MAQTEDNPTPTGAPEPPPAPASTTPDLRPRWQRWLGLRSRPGKRLRLLPTLWGWCLIAFLVFGVGGASFAEYSMQPDFCRSCHLMDSYYDTWKHSKHANVACTDCHFEPGLKATLVGKWQASSQLAKYVTKTYASKPHAQVSDVSCMRDGCHTRRLLEGKVNWTIKGKAGDPVTIKFDHTPHLSTERRGQHLRCVSCHSQLVHNQQTVVTLDSCFLCHFKGYEKGRNARVLTGCKACHEAPKDKVRLATGTFDHQEYLSRGVKCENCHSDSIKGEGDVPRQVCWNCHNKPETVARYAESKFIHNQHIAEHKVDCTTCHLRIEHNLTAAAYATKDHVAMDSGACGNCHVDKHAGPAELYRGVGGVGVPEMPSPMSRAQVDCIGCHRVKKESEDPNVQVVGQTFLAAQKACDSCHGTKYKGLLDVLKKDIDERLTKAEQSLAFAKAEVLRLKLDPPNQLRADRLLDDAATNIRLVKLGHGIHNVTYATALLNVATEKCTQAAEPPDSTPAQVGIAK